MKFLVAGVGSIGKRHLANLLSLGVQDIMVCEPMDERRQEIEGEYSVRSFSKYSQALAQRPEVVLICTPTSRHINYALEAAEQGCHLFIEKPISDSLDGVDKLIRLTEERKLTTLVGCNFRFHWGMKFVKQLLMAGEIGRIMSAHAEFGQYLPDWHPWEDYRRGYSAQKSLGGGIILDSIHELDYLYWLLGMPQQVFCLADKLSDLEINTEDMAKITMKFATPVIAGAHLDYIQRAYHRSLKLVGEAGTIIWNFGENIVEWYTIRSKNWQSSQRELPQNVNEMYMDEIRHFLACLRGEEKPTADARAGKNILRIALAAKQSATSGKAVALQE